MPKTLVLFFCFFSLTTFCQIKTLIPLEEEVRLPLDSSDKISMSVSFAESKIKQEKLIPLFLSLIDKTLNPNQYHVIDNGSNFIELFIVYPCRGFNISNIQSHEIINEGIITSSLIVKFKNEEYYIELSNFEWVDRKKVKYDLDKMYQQYNTSSAVKDKVKYYGILKSSEMSIAETFSNLTVIIEEVIKQKSMQ